MKLPRLHIRELVNLTAFIGLICQSVLLGMGHARIVGPDSGAPGYVWVTASHLELLDQSTRPEFTWVEGRGMDISYQEAKVRTRASMKGSGYPGAMLREDLYYLVPKIAFPRSGSRAFR